MPKQEKGRKFPRSALLAGLLALTGLGILLYPTLSDLYLRGQILRELREYDHVVERQAVDYSQWWAAADAYNAGLAGQPGRLTPGEEEKGATYDLLNPGDSHILGQLDIPAINVTLPIYRGTEEKQLQSGAGWWIGTSLPTGGAGTHTVITAHTGLSRAKLFTDLDQLKEGDRFTVKVLDRLLTYEVDQILVTEPEDVEPLNIVEGESYVTLYTCTPYGVNTHRLLVRGKLVPPEEEAAAETAAPEGPAEAAESPSGMAGRLALLLPAAGLGVLAVLYLRGMTRHGKRELPKKTE